MRLAFSAEPAERQDHQFAAGHFAMRAFKFGNRRIGEHSQRGLSQMRIAACDPQRIMPPLDQLHTQHKAMFSDKNTYLIEQHLIIAAVRFGANRIGQRGGIIGQIQHAGIDQTIKQLRALAERLGQRRRVA